MGQLFGQLLKAHRETHGVSGYVLQHEHGFASSLLSELEKGKRKPSAANLDALAAIPELKATREQLQAWADADKVGREGLGRIKKHVPELLGLVSESRQETPRKMPDLLQKRLDNERKKHEARAKQRDIGEPQEGDLRIAGGWGAKGDPDGFTDGI